MRTFGIDVSHWEGRIDWPSAVTTLGFAYFKCTDGIRFVDEQYSNNHQACSALGIPHAPYHYFQPSLDPCAQADHFISTAGKGFARYILDVEEPEHDSAITQKLRLFLERVQLLTGVRPAIYTSAGYWNEYIQPRPVWAGHYQLVVAHYTAAHTPLLPIGWSDYTIWQFTDNWNFPGCAENADGNWFNGTLEQARQWFGNYHPFDAPPSSHTRLRSQFDHLHIRQEPSAYARVLGYLVKNEVIELSDLGGEDAWVRHDRGWSCVERKGYRYMEVVK